MTSLKHGMQIALGITLFTCNVGQADSTSPKNELPKLELQENCHANEYELAQCLAELSKRTDAELTELRSRIRTELEESQRKPFDELYDAWKTHRQASCKFDVALAAGSSASARFGFCVLTQTQLQIRALSKYLDAMRTGQCGNDIRLFMIELGLQCSDH
jgi:uncharacterized protein YecT (DUF1311 family)